MISSSDIAGDRSSLPSRRERSEGCAARTRIGVLAGDHPGGDLVEPASGVDFALEVTSVLPAVEGAVASAQCAVGGFWMLAE